MNRGRSDARTSTVKRKAARFYEVAQTGVPRRLTRDMHHHCSQYVNCVTPKILPAKTRMLKAQKMQDELLIETEPEQRLALKEDLKTGSH